MTDTIEAGKVAASIIGMPGTLLSQRAYDKLTAGIETYASARITAHTKALIEGAGELCTALKFHGRYGSENRDQMTVRKNGERDQAAATIAAQKAEIERLTEREARAKLDGVRAGIEAAFLEVDGMGTRRFTRDMIAMLALAGKSIRALDAAAIAKGEGL